MDDATREKWARYDEVFAALKEGGPADWAALHDRHPEFPHGLDPVFDAPWMASALCVERVELVRWMIEQGVDLTWRDGEGYTAVLTALECKDIDKRHALLRLLLAHGAVHDTVGWNFFTAAHVAALSGDVEALRILHEHGADLCVATDSYCWRAPADVARREGHQAALDFIDSVCQGKARKHRGP